MAEIDKVKWLKEHGALPQFNQSMRVIIDKDGNATLKVKDKMNMRSRGITK